MNKSRQKSPCARAKTSFVWCLNRRQKIFLGLKRAEDLLGQNVHQLIHHTRLDGAPYPSSECQALATLQSGIRTHSADDVYWKADGTPFHVEHWSMAQKKAG